MVVKVLVIAYALVGYCVGTAGLIALILFLGKWFPSFSLDVGSEHPTSVALLINSSLMVLWTAQHIGMARPRFKAWLVRFLPEHLERSTYMLGTGLVIGVLVAGWAPITGEVWTLSDPLARGAVWGLFAFGCLYAISGILYDSYFEFTGLEQAYRFVRGQRFARSSFETGWVFALSRRPTFFGFTLAFWATPDMTHGHLFFATTMTLFVLVGSYFVERTYVEVYGEPYRRVQAAKPLIVPNPVLAVPRKRGGDSESS